ncbi:MAG: DUF192 domain-containing protein [Candidatus Brocadiae bacterium]|nr:DUF192 domain-containing protein [Candidatus Brocadiia bacterium]
MRVSRTVIVGRDEVLLDHVETALALWDRFRGLMLRKELPAGQGLLLPDCRSIHMFFMGFPIDLVYLDGENRVVKIVPGIKPWRVSLCTSARSVLEMPAGRAEEARLAVGDELRFDRTDKALFPG